MKDSINDLLGTSEARGKPQKLCPCQERNWLRRFDDDDGIVDVVEGIVVKDDKEKESKSFSVCDLANQAKEKFKQKMGETRSLTRSKTFIPADK